MRAASQHDVMQRPAFRRPGWIVALAIGLSACAGANVEPDPARGWINAGSPKELEVDRAKYRHAVYFDTDRAEMTALEQDRLLAFLRSVGLRARDAIRLEGHADERASDVYNLDLAGRRVESVAAFLRERAAVDTPLQTSAFGERAPAAESGGPEAWRQNRRVDVVVERYVVTLPPCPDWSRESGTDFANLPHSNFGCATQTNLGLMVAEPRDLVRGRALAPADGVREAEAVVRYRKGELNELKQETIE